MKSLFLTFALLCAAHLCFSQNGWTFNYQAVIRDGNNAIKVNRNVNVRLSILEELKGIPIYSEEHPLTTSSLGLVNMEVGNGTNIGGTVNWLNIDWFTQHYLRTEVDINGGTDFQFLGESKINTVPLAHAAKNAMLASNVSQNAFLNVAEVNSPSINSTNISSEFIAGDNIGFFNDLDIFVTVIKKNNNLIWLWFNKMIGGDICADKLEMFDDAGNPKEVLDVEANGNVTLQANEIYTGDFVSRDPNGNPKVIIDPTANPNTEYIGTVNGNWRVNGILMGTTKQFVIDHPLDPEHKNLRHWSIESDKMVNLYTGTVTLDKKGQAWVQLPDWFEALNMDFTYQLTCIGGYANVYIDEKINQNKFKIAGGKKNLEVSWQVSGARHDKQALEQNMPVEELKQH